MITIEFDQKQWERLIDKSKNRLVAFKIEFLQDMGEAVVYATPVKTGFLRGNWYAQIGQRSVRQSAGVVPAGTVVAQINLVAATAPLGSTIHYINGTVYAPFVEYGTSRMAPRAMVARTVARARAIADAAAKRVAAMK